MTNAHSENGQMAVCCQNLPLGALSSRSAFSVLVGALFKKFGILSNKPRFRKMHKRTVCHHRKCVPGIFRTMVETLGTAYRQ